MNKVPEREEQGSVASGGWRNDFGHRPEAPGNRQSEWALERFKQSGDAEAFSELVKLHAGLVYSTALRLGKNNPGFAEDVSQIVFTDLSRKAASVQIPVAAWLYRHTWFTASKMIRGEIRRQRREEQAVMMQQTHAAPEAPEAEQIRSLLDPALMSLPEEERQPILLRYFEGMSLREVGSSLKISEEAAQKRVSRALEKLREAMGRLETSLPAGAIATFLAQENFSAPASVVLRLASLSSSLAPVSVSAGTIGAGKTKAWVALALAGAVSVPLIFQVLTIRQMDLARKQLEEQLSRVVGEKEQLNTEQEQQLLEIARLKQENLELHRLRAEVGRLREQLAKKAAPAPIAPAGQGEKLHRAITQQVVVETRFISLAKPMLGELAYLGVFFNPGGDGSAILSDAQSKALIRYCEEQTGVSILAAPRMTTLSGRQAQVQVTDKVTVSNEIVTVGPVVNLIPEVDSTGTAVQLRLEASFSERVLKPAVDGNVFVPQLRKRSATRETQLMDGQTLVFQTRTEEAEAEDEFLVLVQPWLIDASGNRVHPAAGE